MFRLNRDPQEAFELWRLSESRYTPGVPAISCCEIDEIWLGWWNRSYYITSGPMSIYLWSTERSRWLRRDGNDEVYGSVALVWTVTGKQTNWFQRPHRNRSCHISHFSFCRTDEAVIRSGENTSNAEPVICADEWQAETLVSKTVCSLENTFSDVSVLPSSIFLHSLDWGKD